MKVDLAGSLSEVVYEFFRKASSERQKMESLIKEFEKMRPYINAAASDVKTNAEFGIKAFDEFMAKSKELGVDVPTQLKNMVAALDSMVAEAKSVQSKYYN